MVLHTLCPNHHDHLNYSIFHSFTYTSTHHICYTYIHDFHHPSFILNKHLSSNFLHLPSSMTFHLSCHTNLPCLEFFHSLYALYALLFLPSPLLSIFSSTKKPRFLNSCTYSIVFSFWLTSLYLTLYRPSKLIMTLYSS